MSSIPEGPRSENERSLAETSRESDLSHTNSETERREVLARPVLGWGMILWGVFIVVFSRGFAEVTSFWWLILIFGLVVPLISVAQALVTARDDSRHEAPLAVNRAEDKQRQLLEALARDGELTSTMAALRTELTVEEAAELLEGLAGKGHLRVSAREGAMVYALLERDRHELLRAYGESSDDSADGSGDEATLIEPLSQREHEVLGLLASGRSNGEIARDLHVTVGTVKAHASSIYRKLGAKGRAEAVFKARKLDLLG
ncbi:MAG: LuxR C-terminal-related transcriptional regulator [Actinomycetota bacterium]|nr:LuxR C-terminal-related transcriptional regulator [Actinomycetota bacterium]